ncbi:DMT family transporter [Gorillibacterium timonense]|uniref:DMT family transporter n=1 Tax=Gorillibacterium timonense TaxID=1689269 RepID=UPI00071CF376|nr:DMT family transporter [Gorillibacterium timonense]
MKKSYVADAVLLGVTIIWGFMFIVVKNALDVMPAITYLAIRFGLASLFMLAVWRLSPKKSRGRLKKSTIWSGIVLGFFLYGGFTGQTVGLLYTTASRAGFLTGFLVIIVPLLSRLFFKTRITVSMSIGIGIAFIGLGLLSIDKAEPFQWGDGVILLGALAFAVHIILTDRITALHDTYPLVWVQLLTVSILCFATSFAAEDWRHVYRLDVLLDPKVAFALVMGSLFATTFAYWAQTYFQRFTSPSHTALIFASEPIFAAIGGYLVAGERMTIQALIGACLILLGILLTEVKRPSAEASQESASPGSSTSGSDSLSSTTTSSSAAGSAS